MSKDTKQLLEELNKITDQYLNLVRTLSPENKEALLAELGDEETINKFKDQELKRFDDDFRIINLLIARSNP